MASPTRTAKPKFRNARLWAACSRCNARVVHSTLKRERLTGLLVCGPSSGRSVRFCLDPWPESLDFQVLPDRSIEPPAEPLPLRYNLDNIWGNGPATGTTSVFATAPKPAPDDATRLQNLLRSVPYYAILGKSAAFISMNPSVRQTIADVSTIFPANYDGTFLPSSSVRTVTPPNAATELANVTKTDPDVADAMPWTPPWGVSKGV